MKQKLTLVIGDKNLSSWSPFLFGENFGIVDAFFAPVVMRFWAYGVSIKDPSCGKYMLAINEHSAVKEWVAAAKQERPIRVQF